MGFTEQLAEEYEGAEIPTDETPMREGDEYIAHYYRNARHPSFVVGIAWERGAFFGVDPRITKRTPVPKANPWDGLAAHLDTLPGCLSNAELAENLYATGWLEGRTADPTGGDRDGV